VDINTIDSTIAGLLRSRLLGLARRQDELAAGAAMATPYWKPQPTSVHAHRAAADDRSHRGAERGTGGHHRL
jgi:hypothetical protein